MGLNVLDLASTYWGLGTGQFREANPLMAWAISSIGTLPALVAGKISEVSVVGVLLAGTARVSSNASSPRGPVRWDLLLLCVVNVMLAVTLVGNLAVVHGVLLPSLAG